MHVAVGLDPFKARAYHIADNATAAIADRDPELLLIGLGEMKALDFDLDLLGCGPRTAPWPTTS